MNTIRRGLKRKEPGQDPEAEEYQAGLNQFQAAVRKRESIRLKLQMTSAPGVMEKELRSKIDIEESVCKVKDFYFFEYSPAHCYCWVPGNSQVYICLQERRSST